MPRFKTLTVLGAAVVWVACMEPTGPPRAQSPPQAADAALHFLHWGASQTPRRFAVIHRPPRQLTPGGDAIEVSASAQTLESNQVSFWAVYGTARSIQIDYQADEAGRFLMFSLAEDAVARWPDGSPFVEGDSVLITVLVDTSLLLVDFQPSGLVFNENAPAKLQIWYEGADQDLDRDGRVNGNDVFIEQELLGVWSQEESSQPWMTIPAVRSAVEKSFEASLFHFTGYAVSY